jgi:hypothetical protein
VAANPNPSRVTDAMWRLWESLQAMEPTSALGGIYANKPGYHNARRNLPSYDYSVCDQPPDGGGPGDKAAALDWTFPEAQSGDYGRISRYTKRLLSSAQDMDDPRLDGWREFYGQADTDSYVEGWDCRYGHAASSDSSHLWHIHLSVNRDQTTSQANTDALLSVLRGETTDEWSGEVSADDVWQYDIDPSGNRYSAGGATWTVYQRTDYLANEFAPMVVNHMNDMTEQLDCQREDLGVLADRFHRMLVWVAVVGIGVLLLGLVMLVVMVLS